MFSIALILIVSGAVVAEDVPSALQKQLAAEEPSALARDARRLGDPARGALFFYQSQLACAQCHRIASEGVSIGPDLTKPSKDVTDAYLVESILTPSKVIKKGYETLIVATKQGRVITGLLAEERPDAIVLRDPNQADRVHTILRADIDEQRTSMQSTMPDNLMSQLRSRQEFLDLARYVFEISDKGVASVLALRPAQAQFGPIALPEYEKSLDHAGLIGGWDKTSLARGEKIYTRLCINCHGTQEQPGSLPTALRFSTGKFKNGSDPYSMYQTLTKGYGMMTPQHWMVPKQKYDVIHYIREVYLKPTNGGQYTAIDTRYLAGLPKGTERGPDGVLQEPWVTMDYGPHLIATYEIPNRPGQTEPNFAYKGIAVRLDPGPGGISRGSKFMMLDHDTLRLAAAWSGPGFMNYQGINFNGRHQIHPSLVGTMQVTNPVGPGWANPEDGSFDDPRLRGRDGRRYGPLPRAWAHYKGLYHFGPRVIVSYTVGKTAVLETSDYEMDTARPDGIIFTRTLNLEPASHDLVLRVAPSNIAVAVVGDGSLPISEKEGFSHLKIPASASPRALKVLMTDGPRPALESYSKKSPPPQSLANFLKGGPRRWPEVVATKLTSAPADGPFAVDVLELPQSNPWSAQTRLSGFDFFQDGNRAAVCAWDGDVWIVHGLTETTGNLRWQRIASGLFQPLGLKIVNGTIHVACRDQIVRLHDLNGDGEIDFYENFNNDHQVTDHFHEFAMGLQTDDAGNFYYARAARHALKALVPHHGTLLKVSKDGSHTDILATGFRAPNGVCLNPDGTFFLSDQEGFWLPKNRINHVKVGSYHGNFWGYHELDDSSDQTMAPPVCWITNAFDRSPSELLWVTSDRWGPLKGSLLNFSYGYGKIFVVPHEMVGGNLQGGMVALPIPQLPTGVMRGRFHPGDGQLYCCGMFAWAGNQTQPGGFYRIRYTGKPVHVPTELNANKSGMTLTFTAPLDPKSAGDLNNYAVKTWGLKRSAAYGSKHIDEKPAKITAVSLTANGKAVTLEIANLVPTWCMEIRYAIRSSEGAQIEGTVHNTIHAIPEGALPGEGEPKP